MIRVPERLKAIADEISPGASVADIGLDHALLSLYLVDSGRCPRIIGVENQSGPYQKALEAIRQADRADHIELRFGSGLAPLSAGEVDEVVIAGMGGETMTAILDEEPLKASSFQRYVFQPMSRLECLREFLASRGWHLTGERAVYDQERFYIIVTAAPGGQPYRLNRLELDIGPIILRGVDADSRAYMRFMLRKFRTRLSGLQISRQRSSKDRISDILLEIRELEAVLHVLEG